MDLQALITELFIEFSRDKLLLFAMPLFLLITLLEYRYSKKRNLGLFEKNDTKASFWMLAVNSVVEITPKFAAFIAFYFLHEISPLRDIVGRQWWAWVLLFFMDDFSYYWFHRSNHEVRFLWAGHVPHHSATHMNFATALRQGVGERFHKYFFWVWLPLLGFDPLMIFTMISINLFYQFFVHTELIDKLPRPIELFFNTPSHHRVHHASNIRYLDCNHAGVLIIWDRMFGTFSPEHETDKPVYGLTTNITSFGPVHVATHEYQGIWRSVRGADKWSDKLKYILLAPGWSPEQDRRAKVLRKELQKQENAY